MTKRRQGKLTWWWRTPAILSAVMLFALPILCRSGAWAEYCCTATAQTEQHDHHDHSHHHGHGHHHDHGDHHHPEPSGDSDGPQRDTLPECCDTLLASAKQATGFSKLQQELHDNFAAHILAVSDTDVTETPRYSRCARGRPLVFRLREYCALTSLPHGPPSIG